MSRDPGAHPPLAAVRGKAVGAVSLIYRCDGPGCKKPEGEPRGPASALPAGWVCVVVDGKMRHLCLACEKARRDAAGPQPFEHGKNCARVTRRVNDDLCRACQESDMARERAERDGT